MKRLLLLAALLSLASCDGGATALIVEYPPATVLVEVSGGFAPADYAYRRTPDDVLVGVRCAALCDFQAGDTLHVLSDVQAAVLAQVLGEVAGTGARSKDYGVPCCDQRAYRITFSDGSAETTVSGAASTLPDAHRHLVELLEELRTGVAPVVVAGGHPLEGAPHDPVEILSVKLEAPILELSVRYGGGCARHDFDLIVTSGWRESSPVQVDVDLAHDGHDDPCDALPTETVRFDLTPLRQAWEEAYGSGPGAMAIQLGAASGGSRTTVTWSF